MVMIFQLQVTVSMVFCLFFFYFFFVFSRRWAGFKHRPGFQHRDSQWQSTFKASRFTMICIRVPIQ